MEKEILVVLREQFADSLNKYLNERTAIERKMEWRRQQIERLKAKEKKLSNKHPHWTEGLLRPVVKEIHRQLPGWSMDEDTRLTPMGLGCRVSVFFFRRIDLAFGEMLKEENSIYIVFLPGELSAGELLYETGEVKGNYQAGTIGAINGFNNQTKPLESISEAVNFLKNQIQ